MKLIVDIDENYYKGICKIVERFGKRSVVLSTPEKIMFNGTPLSEELEKIKEEIDKKGWYNRHDKEQFAEIIDKHIKEIEQERTMAAEPIKAELNQKGQ